MKKSRYAFTMIEVVFVIAILGILAAIAIPRFAATRNDAIKARGKADIASIRSSIVSERQTRLIQGLNDWIPRLSTGTAGDNLFTGASAARTLLTYGIATGGQWANTANTATVDTYTFTVAGVATTFTYTVATGRFECAAGVNDCDELVN